MKLKEIGHIELENRADKDARKALVTALMLMGSMSRTTVGYGFLWRRSNANLPR